MKYLITFSILASLFSFQSRANLESRETAKLKHQIHKEIRDTQWPNRNTSQGIQDFLSKLPSQYSELSRAARRNDYESFITIWEKTSEENRHFLISDFDFYSGRTLFHVLVRASKGGDDPRIMQAICPYQNAQPYSAYGYTLEGVDTADYEIMGETPLTSAINYEKFEMAQALIDCGADVNKPIRANDVTPLMLAASWGNEDLFKSLIAGGADSKLKDSRGQTAFYYLNLGRIQGLHKGSTGIRTWLEEHGHDFKTEALRTCKGFSAKDIVQSRIEIFVPIADLGDGSIDKDSIPWESSSEQRRQSKIENMQKKLLNDCKNEGYESCTIIERPDFLPPAKIISTKVSSSENSEEGRRYKGLLTFYAGVLGSSSGDPKDCKQ